MWRNVRIVLKLRNPMMYPRRWQYCRRQAFSPLAVGSFTNRRLAINHSLLTAFEQIIGSHRTTPLFDAFKSQRKRYSNIAQITYPRCVSFLTVLMVVMCIDLLSPPILDSIRLSLRSDRGNLIPCESATFHLETSRSPKPTALRESAYRQND